MAHIQVEQVSKIRAAIKEEFPNYVFSVRRSKSQSSVEIAVIKSDLDFDLGGRSTVGLNPHHTSNYNQEQASFVEKLDFIAKKAPFADGDDAFFDKSDTMTDYFHTSYYINLSAGTYERPYQYAPSPLPETTSTEQEPG